MGLTPLDNFEAIEVQTEETSIFLRRLGSGPGVLLLHGFPQTHLMWREVAPSLAHRFTVICADLRGYGRSGCPASRPDHGPYSRRVMASDMASVMAKLGFPSFSVAGHDRGGRVAYRLALDHRDQVDRLAVQSQRSGSGRTRSWPPATGRGYCWRSLSHCLSGLFQPPRLRPLRQRFAIGSH